MLRCVQFCYQSIRHREYYVGNNVPEIVCWMVQIFWVLFQLFILGPLQNSHHNQLREAGVQAVVNCCEEYSGPVLAYERHGMSQLRIPTFGDLFPSILPGLTDLLYQTTQHHRKTI